MRMRVGQTFVAQCCLKHALQYGNGWFLFAAAQGCHAPRMKGSHAASAVWLYDIMVVPVHARSPAKAPQGLVEGASPSCR